MHGAKAGRPVTHGRRSRYAAIFGEAFEALVRDPEIRDCASELALFDHILTRRAGMLQHGLNAEWFEELAAANAALRSALFETRDIAAIKSSSDLLHRLISRGGSVFAAENELLAAARPRAEIALKAEAVIAKRDAAVTESNMIALFGKMLDVITDVVGADQARQVQARFAAECGFGVGEGPGGASTVAN